MEKELEDAMKDALNPENLDIGSLNIDEKEVAAFKKQVIKQVMQDRALVNVLLTAAAQNLVDRGKVHGNSTTDDTELYYLIRANMATNSVDEDKYLQMMNTLHTKRNDYVPGHFANKVYDMDAIQLIEYVSARMIVAEKHYDAPVLPVYTYMEFMQEAAGEAGIDNIVQNTIVTLINLRGKRTEWTKTFHTAKAENIAAIKEKEDNDKKEGDLCQSKNQD